MKMLKRLIPILLVVVLLVSASCSNDTAPPQTTYTIGDEGPAKGIIFYDKGYYSDGWRYLEVAPNDLGDRLIFGFYRDYGTSNLLVGTSTEIGKGKENTEKLIEAMEISAHREDTGYMVTDKYSAKICADYTLNGYDDWFLPSRDELALISYYLGDYYKKTYWSSSEIDESHAYTSAFVDTDRNSPRSSSWYILPVRSF